MRSFELTVMGIVRALSTIDDAVRDKAETLANRLSRQGIEARVEARGEASYAVVAAGESLFIREFGGMNRQPEGLIEEAVQSLKAGNSE